MSLRVRLSLLITTIFAIVFVAGSALIIQHARQAVADEIGSTVSLTSGLIAGALAGGDDGIAGDGRSAILGRIAHVAGIRHLRIEQVVGRDPLPSRTERYGYPATDGRTPSWFVRLVQPDLGEMQHVIPVDNVPPAKIVIRAEPSDEIAEAWEETRVLLGLLTIFFILATVATFITIGRALRPIRVIVSGLENIGRGDFDSRLPELRPQELGVISDRFNHMAEILTKTRRQNRFLAQQSLAIQEAERRRLARELHDEMGQSISAIKAIAISIAKHNPEEFVARQLKTIAEICTDVYDMVRRTIYRLRPGLLDELGLVPALEASIEDWNEHHQAIFCRLTVEGQCGGHRDDIEITVFRIVQECLTNIAKHANASSAEVYLFCDRENGLMRLRVSDNGQGFHPDTIETGVGLFGMRERVEAMNGRFALESHRGAGATIIVELPLRAIS